MTYQYVWTDGSHPDFIAFSACMEEYYNQMVGGAANRKNFIPYNALAEIHDVLIVYSQEKPIACAAFKAYNTTTMEIKRVWVSEAYRGQHIAKDMMTLLEARARQKGHDTAILQTRAACTAAVALYQSIGYRKIENYPPYDKMEAAVCYEKSLLSV